MGRWALPTVACLVGSAQCSTSNVACACVHALRVGPLRASATICVLGEVTPRELSGKEVHTSRNMPQRLSLPQNLWEGHVNGVTDNVSPIEKGGTLSHKNV